MYIGRMGEGWVGRESEALLSISMIESFMFWLVVHRCNDLPCKASISYRPVVTISQIADALYI